VFLDEAGFLMAPLLRRTWAPQGHTPALRQRTRQHKKVSAIASLCIPPHRNSVHCVFRLYPDQNIDGERVIGFLRALLRHLSGPIVLLWDSLKAHRARLTTRFVEQQARLHLVILPSYAPELNPVEYLWCNSKMGPMANFAALKLEILTQVTRRTLSSIQHQPDRLRRLLAHSPLSLRLR
jgi:DDE superfamily endonuclease